MTTLKLRKGDPYPLGATLSPEGVNFAIFSEHATKIELCLFDAADSTESNRIELPERRDQVWHGLVTGLRAGQLYGYRIHGPYEPDKGHRFNPHKVLLDPYAKAVAGQVKWGDEMFGYKLGAPEGDLVLDERDNALFTPKSVVVDPAFDWGSDCQLRHPFHETVVYEIHVKGFSKLWDVLPSESRGTYAAIGSDEAIAYFKTLGVTAVELLPVHQHVDSRRLIEQGLSDYWGYNTMGFFAPDARYAQQKGPGAEVQEFKTMVKRLHTAGLEVILDVVYNHTAEGNHLGPTLGFRGVDNANYYRLVANEPRHYMDYTGTGNTLNVPNPRVLQLVMDSLRYWVTEMHVDGFRFDLAPTLARELHDVSRLSSFFDVIHQDPILSQVKLIAEPWDVGEGGYQVGNFPVLWAEWNGRYRDTVRRFWKGDHGHMRDFAYRLCGSSDLYQSSGKTPSASVNFLTAHDGFTLRDLVSFSEKHNEANGEKNQDGDNGNHSWNWGHEGLDAPPEVEAVRRRLQRSFMATLFLSQGVPMLRGGDEAGATQQGNNNAYCQDNEISWLTWNRDESSQALHTFTRRLIELRLKHPIFHQPRFLEGREIRGSGVKDLTWLNLNGEEMSDEAWNADFAKAVGLLLNGEAMAVRDDALQPIRDASFILFFNAHHEAVEARLPGGPEVQWTPILDTYREEGFSEASTALAGGQPFSLRDRSVMLFEQTSGRNGQAPSGKP